MSTLHVKMFSNSTTSPIVPSSISCLAFWTSLTKRNFDAIVRMASPCSAASNMRWAITELTVIGFSQSTWMPRRSNSQQISPCELGGVQTIAASIVSPARRDSTSSKTLAPCFSAIATAAALLTSTTATSCALSVAANASEWVFAMAPAPIKANRIGCFSWLIMLRLRFQRINVNKY